MPSTRVTIDHDDLHDPLAEEAVRDFPMGMATAVTTAGIPGGAASLTRATARLPRRSSPMAVATDSQTTAMMVTTATGQTMTAMGSIGSDGRSRGAV